MGKLQLEGKTALLCGGSDGLGYGAAVELAMAGAKIVIVGRSSAKLDEKSLLSIPLMDWTIKHNSWILST